MRLLVCGSREWADPEPIEALLRHLQPAVVIHGGARGADRVAHHVARKLGIPVEIYEADWETHGKRAGMKRNIEMLNVGKPDYVLAFKDDFDPTRTVGAGTEHMVRIAQKAGVTGRIIRHAAPIQQSA